MGKTFYQVTGGIGAGLTFLDPVVGIATMAGSYAGYSYEDKKEEKEEQERLAATQAAQEKAAVDAADSAAWQEQTEEYKERMRRNKTAGLLTDEEYINATQGIGETLGG